MSQKAPSPLKTRMVLNGGRVPVDRADDRSIVFMWDMSTQSGNGCGVCKNNSATSKHITMTPNTRAYDSRTYHHLRQKEYTFCKESEKKDI